jgi:hypothetical protein
MEGFGAVALIVVFILIAILGIVWHFSRSDSVLRQWADRNGYRLIDQEYRNVFKGPFFWTSTKGQTVYYVTVEDGAGRRRKGWVRCGGWFLGLMSDAAEVRWDDEGGA